MWDRCRSTALPPMLANKLRLYKARGHLVRYDWESFQDPSWISMYEGFDIQPATYDLAADHFSEADLAAALDRMRSSIADAVDLAEPHETYLNVLYR